VSQLSDLRQRVSTLVRERGQRESENLSVGRMKVGSLIQHYKKCGKRGCVCRKGHLHGPYWYISRREAGRPVLQYVDRRDLARADRETRNHRQFQTNRRAIRRLNREIEGLLDEIKAIRIEEGKEL